MELNTDWDVPFVLTTGPCVVYKTQVEMYIEKILGFNYRTHTHTALTEVKRERKKKKEKFRLKVPEMFGTSSTNS